MRLSTPRGLGELEPGAVMAGWERELSPVIGGRVGFKNKLYLFSVLLLLLLNRPR
jgi:hypothetical protein